MAMNPRLLRPKASGFNPKSIANLAAWYDASVASSITLNGSSVSQWNDQSGQGRHLSQSTAASQPAYETNILNGKPVVTFDGSGDVLSVNASATGVTNVTFIAVIKFVSQTGDDIPIGIGAQNQTKQIRAFYRATGQNNLRFASWGNDTGTTTVATNSGNHRVFSARQNGKTIVIRGDGAGASYDYPADPLAINDNTLYVGGFPPPVGQAGVDFFANISVAEVLIYYADIGASAASAVEKYLGAKWGIVVA